jgi:TonB family protein
MNLILSYALNAVWQLPLVAGAGWLVSRICRKAHPRVLHRVWVFTLLLAVLAPALGISHGWFIEWAYDGSASVHLLAVTADALPQDKQPGHALVLSRTWSVALTCVYSLMLFSAVTRLLISLIKAQTLARDAQAVLLTPAQDLVWQRCRSVFETKRVILRSSHAVSGPAVIGWLQPILLLPANFLAETPDDELLAALAHECAHIERCDYAWNLLYAFLALPLAWHPVTAMLRAQIEQTRELACDQGVAEAVMQPTLYAGALLRLASRMPAPMQGQNIHAVGIFDANILEERVMNLKSKRVALGWTKKCAMAAAALVVAGGCTVSAVALSLEVDQAQASSVQSEKKQVYAVGGAISAPTLIYSVDPKFPRKGTYPSGFQGVVDLKLVVDRKGSPRSIEIVRSLAPSFDEAAMAAVQKYRFKPAMRDGQPVDVSVHVEVNFKKY